MEENCQYGIWKIVIHSIPYHALRTKLKVVAKAILYQVWSLHGKKKTNREFHIKNYSILNALTADLFLLQLLKNV